MLDTQSKIVFPEAVETSRRGDAFVYWASRRRVAVKVGLAGAAVLEACREGADTRGVIARSASALNLPAERAEGAVLSFLDRMVTLGFLGETDEAPPARERPAPSSFSPLILYLHLTVHCNLSCSYCYNVEHRTTEKRSRVLSREEYLGLIEDAAARGVKHVNFTGGEPMLSRDWTALAERAKALGLSTTLLSNGALITARNAETVKRLFDTAIISLDSPYADVHDAQRGRGSHARTMAGIAALREVGYGGLFLRPVLTRHNLEGLKDFPAFAAEHCGTTRFIPATYVPNSQEEEAALQLAPTAEAVRVASQAFARALAAAGGALPASPESSEVEEAGRCGAGSGILSIDFNGDVYPCQAIHDPAMKMGNVRETDFFALGQASPQAAAFRAIDHSDIDICKTCNFNEICGGGCRASAFKLFRSMTAHNPYVCDINKNNAWEQIWSRMADAPDGAAIDPADAACASGACLTGCA